jgi:prepilin-type N-terminal cleavage/methylation domain-containing protein
MRHHKASRKSGFTILEVLAATVIFGIAVYAIIDSQRGSLRNMVQSERYFLATNLARLKMSELELKYQRNLNVNGAQATKGEESGVFDKPYEAFSWKVTLKDGEIDLSPDALVKLLTDLGLEKEQALQQIDQQRLLLTNMNKIIKENFLEMKLEIMWDHLGRKYSLPLVTHLIPQHPKIELTTTIDN